MDGPGPEDGMLWDIRARSVYNGAINLAWADGPMGVRRARGSLPTGRLEIDRNQLTLEFREAAVRKSFRMYALSVGLRKSDVVVFVKRSFFPWLGFRCRGEVHYFGTYQRKELLEVLVDYGYTIDERRARR